uniref:mannan endo-1,4-beta-mannosidase n=1 Tax=Kalanchoe fedtschenkoi TaxID=63787 RepID=A0A7N0V0H2_KALFE
MKLVGRHCQWRPYGHMMMVLLVLCMVQARGDGEADEFIKVDGLQFVQNGEPYYANGFNSYWLMTVASDPTQRYKATSAFQEAKQCGLTLARTWAFSDGPGYASLQPSPGQYNENVFQGLDFVVSEAGKYGIRLVLSLVNNYDDYGGRKQYVEWAKSKGAALTSDDDFYSNEVVKEFYKNHVKAVLTRVNNITGVAYKDDPTIMSWELINEPRCVSDLSGKTLQSWISEMASYLKSVDSNHLLEIGLEGFYGPSTPEKLRDIPDFQLGTDFIANNQINEIDFTTIHAYPEQWISGSTDESQLTFLQDWMQNHTQDAETVLKKPLVIAEFGKSYKSPGFTSEKRDQVYNLVYTAVYSSAINGGAAAGSMFWQLLASGMESYKDGYDVVLSESPSTAGVIGQQSQKLSQIRRKNRNRREWPRRVKGGRRG